MTNDFLHGGALDQVRQQFSGAPEPWVDLSTGINPWPYPMPDISPESVEHLPTSRMMHTCQKAMSEAFEVPFSSLLLCPGSELAIRLLPSFLDVTRVAVVSPTYGDHLSTWSNAGVEIVHTNDFTTLCDSIDAIVICNPNNPDGRQWSPGRLEAIRKVMAERGGWLIVDEAYADLQPQLSMSAYAGAPGLIILRSFGKFFGLAGLRLGALIAPDAVLETATKILGVWPVSGPALEAGIKAYSDQSWQIEMRIKLQRARQTLEEGLETIGITQVSGTDLFRFVRVQSAHQVWSRLCSQGVYVRRFDWSNDHLRIGLPKTDEAGVRLIAALKSSLLV